MAVDLAGLIRGKRVLVTGAGGFIGSHLCHRLTDRGAVVTGLVRYNNQLATGLLRASSVDRVVFGDIRDPESASEAAYNSDLVFHLAAMIDVPYSWHRPRPYVETNVVGTLNMALACGRHKRLVYISSSEVYGNTDPGPISESHPTRPGSPYAASKLAAEHLVRSMALSMGLDVVVVRPFNTYGIGQSTRAIVGRAVHEFCQNREGTVPFGNPCTIRDMTWVDDTVDGIITVGLLGPAGGDPVNLGVGVGVSTEHLVESVAAACEFRGRIEWGDDDFYRPTTAEIACLISNNSKARALGWKPQMSLEEGLRATALWYMSARCGRATA
jgi:dTDP-glucose 4,6-dehydratase